MVNDSAVQFATKARIHMGLSVKDLTASLTFYRLLFDQEPTKIRPRYAKFEVAEPAVNLSLNEVSDLTRPNSPVAHFGIQVKSTQAVHDAAERLANGGVATRFEDQVTCCYAVQNKVWAADPDGNHWEVYVVLDNEGAHHHSSAGTSCCSPELANAMEAVQRDDLIAAKAALEKAGGMSACACLTEAAS